MKNSPLIEAQKLPCGARFYKCALHVNPSHYRETYQGKPNQWDTDTYARSIVEEAAALGITILAVTDHNHVGGIAPIKMAARSQNIIVFPGFEISSSEGVHILCIYPPETDEKQLERYLGEFGIRDPSPSSKLSNRTFIDIIKCVPEQGGVTIAAHVTHNNGLFRVLSGQSRIQAWKDKNLLAIQIPGAINELPEDIRPIVENKNPDYHRSHTPEPWLAIAVVNARDIKEPRDLHEPGATCWIKMSEVSIEGLRQAFLDPGSRIRLNTDPIPEKHSEFVAIAWEGGFLDGAAIHFNENLNVLVGGRGTGKSTVIESLRYILGVDPYGDDARKTQEGIVRNVLKTGTKISLLVRSYRPNRVEYCIERTIPNPPVVRDQYGALTHLSPTAILPQIEIFGQHEIAELAKNSEKQTRLLERFVERNPALIQRKKDIKRQLEELRTKIVGLDDEVRQIEERLASLPILEETLKRYQEAGIEERLKEQSLLVREERILQSASDHLIPFRDLLEGFRQALPIDLTFVSQKSIEDLPSRELLGEIKTLLSAFNQDLEAITQRIEEALTETDQRLASVKTRWEIRKQEVVAAYEKILRELQKSKVDGEEFIRLRRRIEELHPLRERKAILQRLSKEYEEKRQSLLIEWEDLKGEEFRQLERASREINKQLNGRVRVKVNFASNREPLMQLLKDRIGGRISETINTLHQKENLSLKEFANACRRGKEELIQKYHLPISQADRLAQAPPDVVMAIEELDLPHTTEIELNVASEGQPAQWVKLEDLSTGQKAATLLLLLLLESDAPLVVDQPEDDLDNRFITESVVPKMREEKRRRQFIFATHNANIPVLGDAELIIGLTASGEAGQSGRARIPIEHMGSIDALPVKSLVEEVLEGGRKAFEMRRRKYGF